MFLSFLHPRKLFVKGKNMYIIAIATYFKDFLRVFIVHERIRTYEY